MSSELTRRQWLAGTLALPWACKRASPNSTSTIEIFTWWARAGEQDALAALTRVHNERWPSDVVLHATADLSGLARKTLFQRMHAGEPPETFQANIGTDLMRWVLWNGADDRESRLQPLDPVLADEVTTWREALMPELLDHLSYDGKLYAVPANLHRINSLFCNVAVFERHGLAYPKTLTELERVAQTLQAEGTLPLALGTREPWTMSALTFECVLPALQGGEVYDQYFRGRSIPDDPRVLEAMKLALRLVGYANPDHPRLDWLQALEVFIRGGAAMFVMGDWARASIESQGYAMDEDIVELAFPQTEQLFVFTSDTFPLPIGARNQAGAQRLLTTIGSKAGQRAISASRRALPARLDVDVASDPALQTKAAALRRSTRTLALSGVVPDRFATDVSEALAEMLAEDDPEPVILTLRSRYTLLR